MKLNWDKILWSWPVKLLNACCFVFMVMVFAKGCKETKDIERKKDVQELVRQLKSDSI